MGFIYIFAISFGGLLLLIVGQALYLKQKNLSFTPPPLKKRWYYLDLVIIGKYTLHLFRSASRPWVRTVLHNLLRIYLRFVNFFRTILRKHINKLLDHYAEEHDELYNKKPSEFIETIHTHTKKTNKSKQDKSY